MTQTKNSGVNGLANEVWTTLKAIDCSEHTEAKNGLTYLSWAWAYQMVMDKYPTFDYKFDPAITYPNGTMEVSCAVAVTKGDEKVVRTMWLPVMDHRNKSIVNPDSVAINKAKMRCLTKAISMLGLGAYIYAGEDLPEGGEEVKDTFHQDMADELRNAVGPEMAGPAPDVPEVARQVVDPHGNVHPIPPAQQPVQYQTVQTVAEAPAPQTVIADEAGAEELVHVLIQIASNMHSGSMADLADFWRQNKAQIDMLDTQWPTQYAKLKAAFTELKSQLPEAAS